MEDKEDFMPDNFQTADEQNLELSRHLTNHWFNYNIVKIKRISIGSITGWQVFYRE